MLSTVQDIPQKSDYNCHPLRTTCAELKLTYISNFKIEFEVHKITETPLLRVSSKTCLPASNILSNGLVIMISTILISDAFDRIDLFSLGSAKSMETAFQRYYISLPSVPSVPKSVQTARSIICKDKCRHILWLHTWSYVYREHFSLLFLAPDVNWYPDFNPCHKMKDTSTGPRRIYTIPLDMLSFSFFSALG